MCVCVSLSVEFTSQPGTDFNLVKFEKPCIRFLFMRPLLHHLLLGSRCYPLIHHSLLHFGTPKCRKSLSFL
uniref:Uncharacterized protein n=1 Tax=Salix viminalis TaxID=40686 RepID=A0A6N2ME51_SALVM